MSIIKGDFESLRKELSKLGIEQKDINELQSAVKKEPEIRERGNFGKKVGSWIGKMVQKAAIGAWDISVSAAGSILATLIAKYYGF